MKLIDAIKHKGNPYWIPNCSRDDLPEFFKEMGFKKGAEVGVAKAENFEKYLKAGLTMYGIDPWSDYKNYHYADTRYIQTFKEWHRDALKRLKPYNNYKLIRKTSIDASDDIPNRSLDFVYIDGNHKFGYVAMDLTCWSSKVRRGGIVAGHDFHCNFPKYNNSIAQVRYAVEAYTKINAIDNWYVLGRKKLVEGEKNDGRLSFMFFKNW
jgi:hypothetical protein